MSMQVSTPEVKKTVTDYNFVFSSGIGVSYTIDPTVGDSIVWDDSHVLIHLGAKNDPANTRPAEDTTIYIAHLASFHRMVREELVLTPEQRFEWQKQWNAMTVEAPVQ